MSKDFYNILGVSEEATKEEIRSAFRKLAKKYHPDRNQGDKVSEEKFKEVSEAYETLSDSKRKQEYDTLRKYGGSFAGAGGQGFPGGMNGADFSDLFGKGGAGQGGFTFRTSGFGGIDNLGDILNQMLGGQSDSFGQRTGRGRQRMRQARGADLTSAISVSFTEAAKGTSRMVAVGDKKLKIKIPAGIESGGKIRLAGQGYPGNNGAPAGDLIITVNVMTDQNFERKGNDIHTTATISFKEAILGTKADVKTLTSTVKLTVPPGTQPGTKMRLKGQGLAVADNPGDLYVEIKVSIPTSLTDEQRKLLEGWGVEG